MILARRPPASAKARAVALLSRRDHGRGELRRKLVDRGLESSEVDEALDALTEVGLLDDGRTARELARYFAVHRGHGPARIREQLRGRHRLPPADVEDAMQALDVDWEALCSAAAESRTIDPDDLKEVARLTRFLLGRGFPGDLVRRVVEARRRALRRDP